MPGPVPGRAAYTIRIDPGSLPAALLGGASAEVNSLHRHALTGTGRVRVTARAPDGVIEAVEAMTEVFCLGVQWHPEYGQSAFDRAILRAFVERSALYAGGPPHTLPGTPRREVVFI
ncbi:gamma-glutamyl-gamma-aminobutyrate hydrolase family protein [Methylobacterium frigidaeris]|uniref:Gamma-glutamyl-gamma-aminobutyrate hydrolase n=1 Tax=Methylobacterium frigidaeris TaxID=2038277 RepID=A0AA37M505_9HYPH|nr:gamma-glutamyl-gamma-aminobutyrate hydrolase family protein [Methylobacterium frigidaeris]GJD62051.1 hypothetical protein MPEAHAMD_2200 [Methylobacterium frigidaeris]